MTVLADLLPPFTFADQRAQCERCRHRIEIPIKASKSENARVALRCDAIRGKRSCSLARAADGQCGPEATLFQAEVFQ